MEILIEYWYLWLILILLIIGVVFLWKKAIERSRKMREAHKKEMEFIENAQRLRGEDNRMSAEKIRTAGDEGLFQGVAANIQVSLQKTGTPDASFGDYPEPARNVYALWFLLDDLREGKLSDFFRQSTQPLTGQLVAAMEIVEGGRLSQIVRQEFNMFDEDNEGVSLDYKVTMECDERFAQLAEKHPLEPRILEYIRAHADELAGI